jgi:hypothetical protein
MEEKGEPTALSEQPVLLPWEAQVFAWFKRLESNRPVFSTGMAAMHGAIPVWTIDLFLERRVDDPEERREVSELLEALDHERLTLYAKDMKAELQKSKTRGSRRNTSPEA